VHVHHEKPGMTFEMTFEMTFDPTIGIPVLERTPATLRAMLAGLPAAWADATEGPGSWSPRAVVAHLLHADRTNWIPRMRVILDGAPGPVLPVFDPAVQASDATGTTLIELLDELARVRARNLAHLASQSIGDAELRLVAHHPELGRVTLGQLLSTWVAHDLSHVAQIARVMAKQCRDAVGPWRAYLPIMDR
jgi:hypothetical protein